MNFKEFLKKRKQITEDGEGAGGTSSSCIASAPSRLNIGDSPEVIRRSFLDALKPFQTKICESDDSETRQYIDWSIFEAVLSSFSVIPYKGDVSSILKNVREDKDPWKNAVNARKIDSEISKLKDKISKAIRETEENLRKF